MFKFLAKLLKIKKQKSNLDSKELDIIFLNYFNKLGIEGFEKIMQNYDELYNKTELSNILHIARNNLKILILIEDYITKEDYLKLVIAQNIYEYKNPKDKHSPFYNKVEEIYNKMEKKYYSTMATLDLEEIYWMFPDDYQVYLSHNTDLYFKSFKIYTLRCEISKKFATLREVHKIVRDEELKILNSKLKRTLSTNINNSNNKFIRNSKLRSSMV